MDTRWRCVLQPCLHCSPHCAGTPWRKARSSPVSPGRPEPRGILTNLLKHHPIGSLGLVFLHIFTLYFPTNVPRKNQQNVPVARYKWSTYGHRAPKKPQSGLWARLVFWMKIWLGRSFRWFTESPTSEPYPEPLKLTMCFFRLGKLVVKFVIP